MPLRSAATLYCVNKSTLCWYYKSSAVPLATFHEKLDKLYSKYHLPADCVYNTDETGLLNVQQKCLKVLSPNGAKQLGATISQERGQLVTMVRTLNAIRSIIPLGKALRWCSTRTIACC
ncbi:hypothetical protein QYM36_006173 [Artemia franciscana]|uniref:Uncharacterized protein n=1 Tax=Artemia franciscana TaxID=6661 RepID=A0AA88I8Q4_ARTSF|nr:hypothetical protein QYM36_006173 [Artemia franciscana]